MQLTHEKVVMEFADPCACRVMNVSRHENVKEKTREMGDNDEEGDESVDSWNLMLVIR
jgi:hypothetical protein